MKKSSSLSSSKIICFMLILICLLYYNRKKQSYYLNVSPSIKQISETESISSNTNKKSGTKQICLEKKSKKNLIITHGITPEMLTYKHWSGSYHPTTFVITIDNKTLTENKNIIVKTNKENTIIIRYDYSFMNGYKTGSREIEFIISPEIEEHVLTFSWHHPTHLILGNAKTKSASVVAFNKFFEEKRS